MTFRVLQAGWFQTCNLLKTQDTGYDCGTHTAVPFAKRLEAENFTDRPAFAGCIGPFFPAGRLYDMTEIMMACYVEPETAIFLLKKCTDFLSVIILNKRKTKFRGLLWLSPQPD